MALRLWTNLESTSQSCLRRASRLNSRVKFHVLIFFSILSWFFHCQCGAVFLLQHKGIGRINQSSGPAPTESFFMPQGPFGQLSLCTEQWCPLLDYTQPLLELLRYSLECDRGPTKVSKCPVKTELPITCVIFCMRFDICIQRRFDLPKIKKTKQSWTEGRWVEFSCCLLSPACGARQCLVAKREGKMSLYDWVPMTDALMIIMEDGVAPSHSTFFKPLSSLYSVS